MEKGQTALDRLNHNGCRVIFYYVGSKLKIFPCYPSQYLQLCISRTHKC